MQKHEVADPPKVKCRLSKATKVSIEVPETGAEARGEPSSMANEEFYAMMESARVVVLQRSGCNASVDNMITVSFRRHYDKVRYWRDDWPSDSFEVCLASEWSIIAKALTLLVIRIQDRSDEV